MTTYGIPPELQLKKLQGHNKSAIDLSNANPAHGHEDIPRSTSHIMVTTRYSDQQEFKSRKNVMRLYSGNGTDQYQNDSPKLLTPYREQPRSTRIVVAYPRLASCLSNKTDNHQPALINQSKFIKATYRIKIRKIEIPRSMVEEQALT